MVAICVPYQGNSFIPPQTVGGYTVFMSVGQTVSVMFCFLNILKNH